MSKKLILLGFLFTTCVFAQMNKQQIYELVEKKVDTQVILSLLDQNCVDFELDGDTVVELSTHLPPEILKAVVDCKANQPQTQTARSGGVTFSAPVQKEGSAAAIVKESPQRPSLDAFRVHPYLAVMLESNKSSFKALEIDIRILPPETAPDQEPVRFHFKGQSEEEKEVRAYRVSGPEFLEPGNYQAYFYVISERNKGLLARKYLRTDIHKLMVEYQGSGPITLTYNSKEDRSFKSSKSTEITTSGPLVIHSEEKASFDGLHGFEEVIRLFNEE